MAAQLKNFIQRSKTKKEEAAARALEEREKALEKVPRCELNADLPEDAEKEALWKEIHKNFQWSFGPSEGKSLKETKLPFLKWASRKLKDPVKTICEIELALRKIN